MTKTGDSESTPPLTKERREELREKVTEAESMHFASIRMYVDTAKALLDRIDELENLLSESSDWLCIHSEAVVEWERRRKEMPGKEGRVWCCDCSQYLRSDGDVSLNNRISMALGRSEG